MSIKTKRLVKSRHKSIEKEVNLVAFYERFKAGVQEIKSSMDGKTELKDAKTWLNELQK